MAGPTFDPANPNHARFVEFLLADPERMVARAYSKAYDCTEDTGRSHAWKLYRTPEVQALIKEYDQVTQQRNFLSTDHITRQLNEILDADPRELSEYIRGACRYCHGHMHRYQYTAGELERAVEQYKRDNAAQVAKKVPGVVADPMALFFDYKGGVGYNPHLDPHPGCTECFGMGEGFEFFKDTRKLSPGAAKLFAGVERTNNGLRIRMRDQGQAMKMAMNSSGMMSRGQGEGYEDDGNPPSVAITYVQEDATDAATEALRPPA